MSALRPLLLIGLVAMAVACSSGAPDTASSTGSTSAEPNSSPGADAPLEGVTTDDTVVVGTTDDTVVVGTTSITTTAGATLLSFSSPERSCIDATVSTTAELSATLQAAPGPTDDPDTEQTLTEIVLSCVAFDRLKALVADQLAAQGALVDIDRACLEREVASLQDTPDVLASVLRGDPDVLAVVANTASTNCR